MEYLEAVRNDEIHLLLAGGLVPVAEYRAHGVSELVLRDSLRIVVVDPDLLAVWQKTVAVSEQIS
jgi:hypothetical protein